MVLLLLSILVLCNTILAVPMYSEYDDFFEDLVIKYNAAEKTNTISKKNLAAIKFSDTGRLAVLSSMEGRDTNMEGYGSIPSAVCKMVVVEPSDDAPDSFDWRDKKVVTPVKDQGKCKSDWIHGVTGNVESQYAMKQQQLVKTSEQQLLDCQVDGLGCMNGSLLYAMERLVVQGGVESASDYPYEAEVQSCHFEKSKILVKVTGCNYYSVDTEDDLKQLLFKAGPLAITLGDIGQYEGGIVTNCKDRKALAGALLVGYGTEHGVDFWTIKHSFGESFGEKGYSRIQRGCSCLGIGQLVISAIVD